MAAGQLAAENLRRALDNRPKAVMKAGLERGVVLESEYQSTIDMLVDRNTCSHVYRKAILPPILARLPAYCGLMQAVTDRLGQAA
jgi:hypothetical protein